MTINNFIYIFALVFSLTCIIFSKFIAKMTVKWNKIFGVKSSPNFYRIVFIICGALFTIISLLALLGIITLNN